MLKRIPIQQLRLGMHVHGLCGSWMEHPFWRTRFLLTDPQDLERIRRTRIQTLWIDTSKGLDVEESAPVRPPSAPAAPPEVLAGAAEDGSRGTDRQPTSIEVELRRAAAICASARDAVTEMFSEARMGRTVDPRQVDGLVNEISDSVARNPGALISLARLKTSDNYTYMHSVAVCGLMVALARQLGMKEPGVQLAGTAGLLHDMGKAAVPLAVLNKPGRLSDAEFAQIRDHPVAGHALLQQAHMPQPVLDACLHHHEKMDGSGYPHGLQGEQIGLLARMAAICDVYDAITSNRPYKRGWDPSEALRRMAQWTHSHLDSRLFQAFVKTIGIYPAGSLVRLESGRLAVVMAQSGDSLVTPRVKSFFSTRSGLRIPPEVLDLGAPGCTERIAGREDPERWGFPDLDTLWMDALEAEPA